MTRSYTQVVDLMAFSLDKHRLQVSYASLYGNTTLSSSPKYDALCKEVRISFFLHLFIRAVYVFTHCVLVPVYLQLTDNTGKWF